MKMRRMARLLLAVLLGLPLAAGAQETPSRSIPDDVYYLMPSFGKGYVYFIGQPPAEGLLNICALDNTLRFKDKNGQELAATNDDKVVKVMIDTVVFLRNKEVYYRMYPVNGDLGIALKREVQILRDAHQDSYGTVSRTSSVKEYGSILSDGIAYDLGGKPYPHTVSETLFLYEGLNVHPLTRRTLRKFFPDRKAEIDAYFKAGGTLPDKVEEALPLLKAWAVPAE